MMRRLVMVSAGLSVPSSTRLLADRLADAVVSATEARGTSLEIEHVELRPLAHQLADHLLTGFASGDLADAIAKVRRADGLVVVTPVFAASYSGLFKTFVDVLEPGTLDGKPVLIAATGGTARHSMVLDHTLRPLFAHLRAVVVPTGVFAASEDFGNTDEGHLDKRVRRAAGELAALMGVDAGPANQPITDDRRSVEDPFENPTPFDELLRRASER
jgi:FMN reductase